MPLDMSWSIAFHLLLDGFCLGIGWVIAQVIYAFIVGVLSRKQTP